MFKASTAFTALTICLLAILLNVSPMLAQPLVSANNLALGGGGAAYIGGYEANFYNPANLMINDRRGRLHLGIGNAGGFFQPVLSETRLRNQATHFLDIFQPYSTGSQPIAASERELILSRHYPGETLTSQHLARFDMVWGGIHWQGNRQAYSLVARTRVGTRTEVGRGWYSTEFLNRDGVFQRDFHLALQSQVLHEVSLGFAHEFEFINGLLPRINKLYIGIAPKFIVAGAFTNSTYEARYEQQEAPGSVDPNYISHFTHHSSGKYSQVINNYRATGDLEASMNRYFDRDFFLQPTGYGVGIDFGLTYLIALGSDIAIFESGGDRSPIKKSLRLALSITDLGLVYYQKAPLTLSTPRDTVQISNQPPVDTAFIGSPGQFSSFFGQAQFLTDPLLSSGNPSNEAYSSLLPTSVNAGVMLDLHRLKLIGDLTLALNQTAFAGTQLTAHVGVEIRPLPYLPLRAGTTLASGSPIRLGLGTGIDSRYWNISISTQVLLERGSLTSELTGGAIAGIQLHL